MKVTRFPSHLLLILGLAAFSNSAQAATVYILDETNAPGLDGGAVGGSVTETDDVSLITVTLTTVDVTGFDTSVQGSTLSNTSGGATHVTNIGTSAAALGINSDGNGGYNSDATNIQPGEAWEFAFSEDVTLTSIDFESFGEVGTGMTVSSSAFSDIDIQISDLVDVGGDSNNYFFAAGVDVSAGTSITITMTQSGAFNADDSIRIEGLTVTAVPEPAASGLALLGLGALCFSRKRRVV